ncbi:MAG: hypothetical protein D6785_04525 [Planctomycetota bacterium]|nr:MAG: hypothetical protein D6785_04525 [Planctomycetota bacterium]
MRLEIIRVALTFLTLFFLAALLFPFLDMETKRYGLVHGVLRILFEDDLDSIKSLPHFLYWCGFILKMAATYTIPFFAALVLAKFMGIRLFEVNAKHLQNHAVIFGHIPDLETFAKELVQSRSLDIVLISTLEEFPFELLDAELVAIVQSPNREKDFQRANITHAQFLLITPFEDESPQDFKGRTMEAILAAKKLCPDIRIVLELPQSKEKDLFITSEIEEILPIQDYISSLEGKILQTPGILPFFMEITSPSQGNSIFIEPIPKELVGMDFFEALLELKEKANSLLLGVKRNEKIFTNPNQLFLEAGDQIFLIREG